MSLRHVVYATLLMTISLPFASLAAPPKPKPPVVRVASPGDVLAVEVTTDNDGRPSYAVSRLGKPVIAASRLGFILIDAPKLERHFAIAGEKRGTFDQTWEQP